MWTTTQRVNHEHRRPAAGPLDVANVGGPILHDRYNARFKIGQVMRRHRAIGARPIAAGLPKKRVAAASNLCRRQVPIFAPNQPTGSGQGEMFWGKQKREYELQRELDRYAAEFEEMIEVADANENRAFAECHRNEWNYWRSRKRDLREFSGKYMDHARGGSDYWLGAIRLQLQGWRRPKPYGSAIAYDDDGKPRTDRHNVKGLLWEHDNWYVPDPDPQPDGYTRPFRVQIWRSSESSRPRSSPRLGQDISIQNMNAATRAYCWISEGVSTLVEVSSCACPPDAKHRMRSTSYRSCGAGARATGSRTRSLASRTAVHRHSMAERACARPRSAKA